MEMKKISTIFVLCFVVIFVVYFGLNKFQGFKKTVTLSITDLSNESDSGNVVQTQQEERSLSESSNQGIKQEEIREQQPVIENPEEKKVENNQPILNSTDKKNSSAVEKQQAPAEDKTSALAPGKIVQKLITWGFKKSTGRKIDTIIIHSSYDALGPDPYSVSGIIAEYKQYGVSAHYLISRDGTIYQLVADQNIAWHAGVSVMPDGRKNVNDFSIGVEMINTQDGKYTDTQYGALNSLIATLKKKYSIRDVLGHDDIAPGRKTDPWGMDWKKVAR